MKTTTKTKTKTHPAAVGLLSLALSASWAPVARAEEPADLVILGAQVITQDAARPRAQALAVREGVIRYVGADRRAEAMVGPKTRVVRAGPEGLTVLPGLVDAHARLRALGEDALSLGGLSLDGVVKAVRGCMRPGEAGWCLGAGWDQARFPGQAMPERHVLDQAAPGWAVWLRHADGHAGWASSHALHLAGISRTTPDPPGGLIVRSARGTPTGLLLGNAMALVEAVAPQPGQAALQAALLRGAARAAGKGVTAVHEMGLTPAEIEAYRALAAQGRLPLRVYGYAADPVPPDLAHAPQSPSYQARVANLDAVLGRPDREGLFQLRGVQIVVDGGLGTRGAALLAPWADGGEKGQGADSGQGQAGLRAVPEHVERMARWAGAHGFQLAPSGVGDRAARVIIEAYERAGVGREQRFRLEKAQVLDAADVERLGRLGVVVSVQPAQALAEEGRAKERLGPARVAASWARWQGLLKRGVRLCGGSGPGAGAGEADPLAGMAAFMERADPSQRLTLPQALWIYTAEAAYAVFADRELGLVRAGQAADLTLLSGRLGLDGTAADLRQRRVYMTVVAGRVVFEQAGSASP
jgi:hypothetical protein